MPSSAYVWHNQYKGKEIKTEIEEPTSWILHQNRRLPLQGPVVIMKQSEQQYLVVCIILSSIRDCRKDNSLIWARARFDWSLQVGFRFIFRQQRSIAKTMAFHHTAYDIAALYTIKQLVHTDTCTTRIRWTNCKTSHILTRVVSFSQISQDTRVETSK